MYTLAAAQGYSAAKHDETQIKMQINMHLQIEKAQTFLNLLCVTGIRDLMFPYAKETIAALKTENNIISGFLMRDFSH